MNLQHTVASLFSCLVALVIFGSIAHFAAAGGAGTGTQWVGTPYQNPALDTYQPATVSGNATWSTTLDGVSLAYAWNRWTLPSIKPECFVGQSGNFSSDTVNSNCVSGFVTAGSDINVQVTHEARVYDADGAVINNNATLTPGQTVRLEFKKLVPENIFWFATGYSLDSPYGEWRSNAAPPPRVYEENGSITANHVTCLPRDYTNSIRIDDYSRHAGCMKTLQDNAAAQGPMFACKTYGTDGSGNQVCDEYYYYHTAGGGFMDEETASNFCISHGYGPQGQYDFDVYAPLEIAPPDRTLSYGGLNCVAAAADADSDKAWTCTVPTDALGGTTLTPAFNYGETYGYFYYRYYDYRNMDYRSQGGTYGKNYGGEGCYGNNIPLYKIRDNVTSDPNYNPVNPRGLYVGDVESSPFMLDVPAMSVPFTFTVEPTGTPPTAPIIDGPTIGEPSTSYTFSFLSTDPDGDTLHYRIDWDNNGTVTQMLPPSGDVPSGTEKETANQANQWTTEGAKTFKAQAVDSRGATSEWSSHTITLAEPPPVLTCSVSPASIQAGEDAQWSASPSNLGTYTWTPSEGGSAGGSGATLNRTYPFPGNYSMTVSAGGQNANCPVLSVGGVCPAPNTVTLTASPNRVNEGDSTTLTLSGTGIATSCIVTGPGVSQTVAASACSLPTTTIPTGAITVQSTYTVSCDDGAVTDTAIVNLVPKFEEF